MTQPPLTIDVVSDVVCPWCYLGKRRLERTLTRIPDREVTVRWRPFRLDPTIPPEGIDRETYLTRKFGKLDAVADFASPADGDGPRGGHHLPLRCHHPRS